MDEKEQTTSAEEVNVTAGINAVNDDVFEPTEEQE